MGNLHLTFVPSGGFWTYAATLAIVVCLVVLLIGIAIPVLLNNRGGRRSDRREAEQAFQEFHQALQEVRHQYAALEAHSNAYFNTFHAAGWDELRILLDDLELAESSLHILMERGRWGEVRDISWFLVGHLSADLSRQLLDQFEGLENIADWRQRCRAILLRVVQASMDSARKIAAVGVNRNRGAKPTLVTLAEIRSGITQAEKQ